jgi:PAS domain S-box-containing protein
MKAKPKISMRNNGGNTNSGKVKAHKPQPDRVKRTRPLSPKQFINIIERMNDGLVVLDKDWYYVYVNQKAAVMLQRQKPSDLIGKHIWTEYPDGVGQPFQMAYEKAMRDQAPIVFEDHYEPWDLWFENRIYPSPDSLLILFTEITDRKRIERLLNERQYFLQKILDTEPGTVYIYDLDERRNMYINRYWLLTYGYTEEETQAMGDELLIRICHPDDMARISTHHENWRQAGEGDIREFEFRVRSKSGDWHWLHGHEAAFARDEAGKVKQILGIMYEITERKKAEEEVREQNRLISALVETTPGLVYIYDWQTESNVYSNKGLEILLGYTEEEVKNMGTRFFAQLLHPDDGAAVVASQQRLASASDTEILEIDYRLRHSNGEWRWLRSYERPFARSEDGSLKQKIGIAIDITERRQAEQALRESEAKFSKFFYASPIPLSINLMSDGRYVEVNESFLNRIGYQREEVLGRTALELGFWAHPEQREIMMGALREHGSLRNFESQFRTKSGEIGTAVLFREVVDLAGEKYFIGTNLDVTERKQTEDALAASEAELRALFAAMDDVVLVIDREGAYQKIAPTNPSLLTKPPEELLGKTLKDVFPAAQAESFITTIRQVVETQQAAHIEYQLVIDERMLWFDASISPMDSDSILWMARDITDRKQAEAELRQLNEELELRIATRTEELAAAMVKAQESDRLKSAFLAAMSHELRTPLNSIIGFTGVILQGLAGPLNEEQTKQLNMTRDSARHLLALINDVLDISKIEAGQLKILKQPFNMRQAVESTLRVVHPLVQRKSLQLVTSIDSDVGMINNDRRRVEQVLINLVNNAIKFSEHGKVSIECRRRGSWLETSVHDDGIGIQLEDLDRLFKPFQQIDSGLTRSHEGTGLGLVICKRLVTAMGGEITVESQWGVGSTFTFTLPI